MIWKILGWVLIFSAIGNIFGTGNIPVGIIAIILACLCFSRAKKNKSSSKAEETTDVTQPIIDIPNSFEPAPNPYSAPSNRSFSQNSLYPAKQVTAHAAAPAKLPAEQHLAKILSDRFPEYTVKRNVDFSSLTSEWWVCSCGAENIGSFCSECGKGKPANTEWTCQCGCRNSSKFCSDCGKAKPAPVQYEPIDFLLMRDGMPKLAILLVTRNRWNSKPIRSTTQACEEAGIPWQRYFEEYDNEVQYVTDRIRSDLR